MLGPQERYRRRPGPPRHLMIMISAFPWHRDTWLQNSGWAQLAIIIFKSSESELSLSRVFYGNSTNSGVGGRRLGLPRTSNQLCSGWDFIRVTYCQCVARHWPQSTIHRYTASQTRDRARPGPCWQPSGGSGWASESEYESPVTGTPARRWSLWRQRH